ncbi:MAG: hypothetical protein QXG36_07570, partial [Nitrososphaeria archaeon]
MSKSDSPALNSFQNIAFHYWVHNLASDETVNNLNGYYISIIGYTNNLSLNYRVVKLNYPTQYIRVYVEDPGVVLVYVEFGGVQLPNRVVKLKAKPGYNFLYYNIGNYKFTVIESNETKQFLLVKDQSPRAIDERALLYINYPTNSSLPTHLQTNGIFLPYFQAVTENGAMNTNIVTINLTGSTSGYFFTVPRLQQFASFFNSTDFSTSGPYRIGGWALIN